MKKRISEESISETTLISTSVIMAGIGLAVPVTLPLEIAAIICGCMGA